MNIRKGKLGSLEATHVFPEHRGDGSAKRVEFERIKRERERQALKAKKDLEDKKRMQAVTEPQRPAKTRTHNQKRLASAEIAAIDNLVTVNGEQRVVGWLASTPRAQVAQNPMHWARGTLKTLRDPSAPHKSTLLDVAADLLTNFGKPQAQQRVEAVTVPVEVTETRTVVEQAIPTGIVRVGEWSFMVDGNTRQDAKSAVVSCSELAERLKYERASTLKELSERATHKENLSKFGTIRVSRRVVEREGRGSITVEEPLFNRKQALYLIAKSGTPIANDLTVQFIEAFEALLERFTERAIQQTSPVIDYAAMGTAIASAVVTALVPALADRTIANRSKSKMTPPEQLPLPQPEPPLKSEIRRLAEQDSATERKVLHAMIKRLAGVTKGMKSVQYGARMSVAFHQIEDELPKYGHNMTEDMRAAYVSGGKANSLDYFEEKGIVRLAMEIVEKLYEAKQAAKSAEADVS